MPNGDGCSVLLPSLHVTSLSSHKNCDVTLAHSLQQASDESSAGKSSLSSSAVLMIARPTSLYDAPAMQSVVTPGGHDDVTNTNQGSSAVDASINLQSMTLCCSHEAPAGHRDAEEKKMAMDGAAIKGEGASRLGDAGRGDATGSSSGTGPGTAEEVQRRVSKWSAALGSDDCKKRSIDTAGSSKERVSYD